MTKQQQNQKQVSTFHPLVAVKELNGRSTGISIVNYDFQQHINHQKTLIMRTFINQSPTESRRFTYFSNFKDSKRIRWAESRHHLH